MRVRARNRWLLRVPNGMKTPYSSSTQQGGDAAMQDVERAVMVCRFLSSARIYVQTSDSL